MKKKLKNLLVNFFVSIISILFLAFLLELILIAFGYSPLKPFFKDEEGRHLIIRESKNQNILYELTPLAEGYAWGCDVSINFWGFRDKEYNLKKDGTYRIITIGDSITFGNYLPLSDTYAKQLEKMFNDKNKAVEVLNMGCGGYSIMQAISFLQEKGLKFSPDVVVYGFCLNDLMDESLNLMWVEKYIFASKISILKSRLFQLVAVQLYKTKLIRKLQREIKKIKEAKFSEQIESGLYSGLMNKDKSEIGDNIEKINTILDRHKMIPNFLWTYRDLKRIGRMRYFFNELQRMSELNNFEVIILIIPYLEKENEEYLSFSAHNIIRYEAEKHNFAVLDIFDKMDEYGLYKLRLLERDPYHPDVKGHEIIAKALYDYLNR